MSLSVTLWLHDGVTSLRLYLHWYIELSNHYRSTLEYLGSYENFFIIAVTDFAMIFSLSH